MGGPESNVWSLIDPACHVWSLWLAVLGERAVLEL